MPSANKIKNEIKKVEEELEWAGGVQTGKDEKKQQPWKSLLVTLFNKIHHY